MLIFAPFKIKTGHDKSPHQGGIVYAFDLVEKSTAAPRGVVETPPKVIRFEPWTARSAAILYVLNSKQNGYNKHSEARERRWEALRLHRKFCENGVGLSA